MLLEFLKILFLKFIPSILTKVAFESSNDFTYDLPHDELCLSLLPSLTPSHPLSHHQSSICISLDCLILLLVTQHLDVLFHTFSSCPSSDIHFKETSRTAVSFNEWLTCCIAFDESSKKYTFCCTFSASTPLLTPHFNSIFLKLLRHFFPQTNSSPHQILLFTHTLKVKAY